MKIIYLRSSKIFLVKHNQIPFSKLMNVKYIEAFRKIFGFNDVLPQQDVNNGELSLIFGSGLFTSKDGREIVIMKMNIESRKIVVDVIGASTYLDEIYQVVKEALASFVEELEDGFLTPLVVAQETEMVSQLDFSPMKLFPSVLMKKIMPDTLEMASGELAKAHIGTMQAVFQIDYEILDQKILRDGRITLTRKELIIQTANGRSFEEKAFASKAPLSSDDHIKFLESLEKALKD